MQNGKFLDISCIHSFHYIIYATPLWVREWASFNLVNFQLFRFRSPRSEVDTDTWSSDWGAVQLCTKKLSNHRMVKLCWTSSNCQGHFAKRFQSSTAFGLGVLCRVTAQRVDGAATPTPALLQTLCSRHDLCSFTAKSQCMGSQNSCIFGFVLQSCASCALFCGFQGKQSCAMLLAFVRMRMPYEACSVQDQLDNDLEHAFNIENSVRSAFGVLLLMQTMDFNVLLGANKMNTWAVCPSAFRCVALF